MTEKISTKLDTIVFKNFLVKMKRKYKETVDECPLKGFCIYDISEPFTCKTCPEKK